MQNSFLSDANGVAPSSVRYSEHTNDEMRNGPLARPVRLGAWIIGDGVDFAVRAGNAQLVEVCLFDPDPQTGKMHEKRYPLVRGFQNIWAGHIPGVQVGQIYGYRVHGKWDRNISMLHNPAKVLLDPYARAIGQMPQLHQAIYAYQNYEQLTVQTDPAPSSTEMCSESLEERKYTDLAARDERDSAPYAALGVVIADTPAPPTFPRTPWRKTVIYEAHVIGLTRNFSSLPAEIRGTYAALGHPATIKYLQDLGITALELLPIHAKFSEPFLVRKNLENYWGYNTLSYFAPESSYATAKAQSEGPQAVIAELKTAIQNLHAAGIEVLLDVVYNHTCEAGADGPTLSLRGFDNTSYYRHSSRQIGQLVDTTGCGNSLDFRRLPVLQLTLDSLRYWVEIIGVDGFRFDLAVTLGREGDNFNQHHPLYAAMATDPILSGVKLINEPWDLGPNGWQTGNFSTPCADWNDRFRDSVRAFGSASQGRSCMVVQVVICAIWPPGYLVLQIFSATESHQVDVGCMRQSIL
ncbi:alpha-amylase family glycosyl hydrolase [Arcanobacterium hippocoleae]|uniref:alpha-amylase family glycosyl hydrolase n=1 Tax=Arcanobacterium hippocoleae TaxID=149017 RepID=UPI00333E6702